MVFVEFKDESAKAKAETKTNLNYSSATVQQSVAECTAIMGREVGKGREVAAKKQIKSLLGSE